MRFYKRDNTSITFKGPISSREDLILLLDIGLLSVKNIELHTKDDKVVDFSDLSSGEQCVLLSILNIAGAVKDNSIVCIDEPEISLHPSWQRKYIKLLKDCFRQYRSCHFIISTHSPLIISELDEEDAYILEMENNIIHCSQEFSHQSADFQLAKLFNAPGENNEYLKRRAITLLSKNSRTEGLSEEEINESMSLINRSREFSQKDIVRILLELLEEGIQSGGGE